MGNKRWRYRLLKAAEVEQIVSEHKQYLRIETIDGAPHLQIHLRKPNDATYYKTLGRMRRERFMKDDVIPMNIQPEFINVQWYKFKL